MRKLFVLLGAVFLTSSIYAQQHQKMDKWKLVWSDEFNYAGLPDAKKWTFDTHGNSYGWGNNEAQWYTDKEQKNANVANGILRIAALKENKGGKKYTSARLVTKDKGDWTYCRVDVCAKLPTGRGTWPAIWMLSSDFKYGDWPNSGEIDIMEHVGFSPDTVLSTVHTGAYNHIKGTQVGKSTYAPDATKGFHVYSTEWDENEVRSYIDGIQYFAFKNQNKTSAEWPYDQNFHLILNLAIGGGLGGKKGIDDSQFPHYFDIDYVRVYKAKK